MKIVISSGHGLYIRGASGSPVPPQLDEVDEARRVVETVAAALRAADVKVVTFHDDISQTQSVNLQRIVDFHNAQSSRDLDVSVHFNAYNGSAHGTEVLYLTQESLAAEVSSAIADAGGFTDRGAKHRTDLAFLNGTDEPAVLIETCFCDNTSDSNKYHQAYDAICNAIAETIAGEPMAGRPPQPQPPAVPPLLAVPPPTLAYGDRGSCVTWVQTRLAIDVDGEYGAATEQAVEDYQAAGNLSVDGIVGAQTWAMLDADFGLPAYPPPPLPLLDDFTLEQIMTAVEHSALKDLYWAERGAAPIGYLNGMAFGFATMLRKLAAGDAVALITAQAERPDPGHDVLAWYHDEFSALDMDNSDSGVETLRHLWVLLIGLGMRESSGRHCCGRDQSASNVEAETCEAGLLQTSWNASSCSTDFERLFDEYSALGKGQQTGLGLFQQDVKCSQSEWACYGSGIGYDYQKLAKDAPQFACESTALALRFLRQHWGPLTRREVELKPEVNDLLLDIQTITAFGGDDRQPPPRIAHARPKIQHR